MNKIQLVLLVLVVSCIFGCARITKTYVPEPVFINTPGHAYMTENEEIDRSKLNLDDYKDDKHRRDILIAEMLALSDKKCEWHKATIMANANIWNISSGSVALLLTGAAAVVSHAQTAGELASGATVVSGGRSLVNQEIYGKYLAASILAAIDAVREKKRIEINRGIDTDNYTIARAISAIEDYHSSCSLMKGIVELTGALGQRKKSRGEVKRDIDSLTEAIKNAGTTMADVPQAAKDKYVNDLISHLARSQLALLNASE